MAPQKVDKLITLEVAKLITLERPKGGQTNSSPAHIYRCCVYTCLGACAKEPVALLSLFVTMPILWCLQRKVNYLDGQGLS